MIRYLSSLAKRRCWATRHLALDSPWIGIGLLWCAVSALPIAAQSPSSGETDTKRSMDETIVAYVAEEPIRRCDLRYQERGQTSNIQRTISDETIDTGEADPLLRSKRERVVVELIRDRIQVQKYLDENKFGATDAEVESAVDEALERISSRLDGSDKTKGELTKIACDQVGLPLESWKRELRWQLSWKRYTQRAVNDEEIEKYFDLHREQYDGTRLEVAHILRLAAVEDRATRDKQSQQLASLRKSILDRSISFEVAARENSQGVTAATNGGVIGWIAWDGPMSNRFTQAAFALETNEISQPVESEFGVHLIKVLKKEKGKLTFKQCYSVVREAFLKEVFFRLVSERKPIAIRWENDLAK